MCVGGGGAGGQEDVTMLEQRGKRDGHDVVVGIVRRGEDRDGHAMPLLNPPALKQLKLGPHDSLLVLRSCSE